MSNFWYRRGGLETVMLQDAEGLAARGHTVAPFASAHALNEPSSYEALFPRHVNHGDLGAGLGVVGRAREAVRLVRNGPAVEAFSRYLSAARPDLVHQHGISRQLSPSVLERAHRKGIPTVLSLHDYSLRCPRAVMSRPGVPVCIETSCAGHRYDRAVRFKCVHGSRSASAVAAVELLVNRALHRYERAVDLFLVPSAYAADRMAETGIPRDRLRIMPNAIDVPSQAPEPPGDGFFAFGRLIDFKGFDLVVEAARRMPDVRFAIAGEGPEREALQGDASRLPNLDLLGHVDASEVRAMVRRSRAVLVPSYVPETFGMVVLEAWREGRPVIATRQGALSELVDDGVNGRAIEAGDIDGLVSAVASLEQDADDAEMMGRAGYERATTRYGMTTHLDRLEATYQELVR